ncbi:MAG: ABC transporter substrate-binding protein [Alphaproteobacteria bacterium]|nr:ABC transporter substrate-binding protein [Alphaproteobacteria bacterium]
MSAYNTNVSRRTLLAGSAALGAGTLIAPLATPVSAQALEKVTYLFPAPPILPAFGPIRLALGKGYFKDAGLDVSFAVGRGGVDVAKQVGAGNASLGGIVADGPIIVRGNGVPVKIVCVFGGRGFMQLVVREDSGIEKPADLKGKTLTVMSYQDTTFYALLGLMASAGLTQNDVNIQQAGPTGVWQFVAEGKSAGMAGVPDWIPPVQAAGVKVRVIPTETFFPHMAQGIAASEKLIKDNPAMIRKFVQAALRGMKDVMDNPDKAAEDFVSFVPDWKGRERGVQFAMRMYAKDVYPGQKVLGEADGARLDKLQQFYLSKGFIQKATPVAELFTNEFVK